MIQLAQQLNCKGFVQIAEWKEGDKFQPTSDVQSNKPVMVSPFFLPGPIGTAPALKRKKTHTVIVMKYLLGCSQLEGIISMGEED